HLISLQNPSSLVYTDQERRHTFTSDASVILQHRETGLKHAFLIQIDGCDYTDAHMTQQYLWLSNLLAARDTLYSQRVAFPTPLVVTTPDRIYGWVRLLSQTNQERGTHIPEGAITLNTLLNTGVFSPIWWPFSTLAEWDQASTRWTKANTPLQSECVEITNLF